ncbi:PREDICTED: disease resistance protein RPP13-like isoform X6 [Ipomoea nil]|uniref:disease resistance protein RPP13-like isoform X6 n=1 Tax=Ipomoea nil TaxID=35883 RepID=UPI0009009101|nr:PREDICTED: disease resistance protein RPP13-like isoform X6 [Ipomoea nil]
MIYIRSIQLLHLFEILKHRFYFAQLNSDRSIYLEYNIMDFVLITSLLNTVEINLLCSFESWRTASLCYMIRNLQAFLEDSHNKKTRRALESEIDHRGGSRCRRQNRTRITSTLFDVQAKQSGRRVNPPQTLYQTLEQVNRKIKSIGRRIQIMSKISIVMPPQSLYQTLKEEKRNTASIEGRNIHIESKNNHSAAEPQRRNRIENIQVASFSKRSSSMPENNVMVGCEDQFDTIVCKLTSLSKPLQVISLVGMGGIGKTTLIKKVYKDPTIVSYFDVRAWATISQHHNLTQMLIGLLSSNVTNGVDNNHLANQLRQKLMGQRYLIVMDDIWDTKAWDDIQRCFPENFNGSRILLTTRLKQVAEYSAGSGN